MKSFLSTIIASAVLTAVPSLAYAQFATDSSAPTIIDADDATQTNGVMTLTGQVDIRQGDVRLLADKVQIYTEDGTGGLVNTNGFTRMVATGNFFYIAPEQEVRGDKGVYLRADESFVVTGDVILLQDDSVVTGERLNYNLQTRDATVEGDCSGRKCSKGRRVSILIKSNNSAQGTN